MADVHASLGQHDRAAAWQKKLAEATPDPDARFDLLCGAAETWAKRASNLPMAVLAYEDALAIRPSDTRVLHVLLGAYGELESWEKLVETLRRITEVDQDPVKKAKGVFAMAQAVEAKLRDPYRAASLFEEVIAIDPSRLDAFERVVRIHTERKDWNELEKSYRRMLHRTRDRDVELRHALFHQLGLIYRDRIGDAARAIEAFRAAGTLKPSEENRKILTELYVVAGRLDEALADAEKTLAAEPGNAATYATLYELFLRAHAFDRAWCAVSVLSHLGSLPPDQKKFHDDYPPPALGYVPGQIPESAWASHILHPELDPTLTAIFGVMAAAVTRLKFGQISAAQRPQILGEPMRPDHSYNASALLDALRNASDILHVSAPSVFARKGPPAPLVVAHTPTPTLVSSVDALDTVSREALAFLVGKRLAELRPELFGRAIFPTVTEMTTALATAVRVVRGEVGRADARPGGQSRAPDAATQKLDRELVTVMTAPERGALADAVRRATAHGVKLDVKRWSRLVDASSSRAGLLLCGHVDWARRAMLQDGQSACDLPLRARVQELCVFAVSEKFADLRTAIGVGVPTG
jgi:tetratricopeptide (TPR) repeat protein